jgi:hypothetical protein
MSLGSFFPTAMILHVFAITNNFPVYSAAGNGLDDVPVTSLAPVSRRWHGGVPPVSEGWLALRTSTRAMAAALSSIYRVSSYGTARGIIAGVLGALDQAPEADDAPVMLVFLPQ